MVLLQLDQQPYLIQAIFVGEINDVRTALENKQDVNFSDCEKRSPLHAASFKGDAEIAALLISNGARINTKDSQWTTPLHRACCCAASGLVALLLQNQADTTARDKQWQTPLHVAALNNAYDCLRQLLECVPNVNVTDRTGRTALHHAALNGHTDVVELLLSKGCIVNACDKRDCRPIHCASHMGHVETIEMLLRYRADINAKDRNQYSPLHVAASSGMIDACSTLLERGAQVHARNSYGNTPLHIACLNGHLPVCQILISYGADIESTNYRGQSPLHIAAASAQGVDCLNLLVEKRVDINKQSLDGRTPLHMTAIHGRFTRSKTLIDNGAIVDSIDKNGCTALHIAALYGHDLLSNTLLSHGAGASKKGYLGRTPLHMSCLSGFVECCRKFLQAGVDLNAQDDSGKTPVHCAAYKGSVECLDLLVSNGADFNIVDNIGRIPLHYAAVQGHYPCIFTLVGLGSSVNLSDAEGCSPLHLAAAYNVTGNCVEYLLKRKADPRLKDNKGFTPIHYAVAGGNLLGLRHLLTVLGTNYGMYGPDMPLTTPLHLAAKHGNQEILQLVLPYFPDKNIKTEHGSTALLLAARDGQTHCVQVLLRFGAKVALSDDLFQMTPVHYSAKNGHIHCLALLLDNTEDQNVIDLHDSFHRTALMLSVSGGHIDCAHTLLKCGADPNIIDADKHSPLFRAVVIGHNKAVELLIGNGATAGNADVYGKTVLHIAAACGRMSSLETFLKYMQMEDAKKLDNQGCTALHWACYNGNSSCVAFLLKQKIFKELIGNAFSPIHCATVVGEKLCIELLCAYYGTDSIKLKDARNRTPLHIAALHGPVDCAKFLLEQGAEINCKDADGRTPLIAAAQNGQSQIIDLLITYKADVTMYDNNGNTALHVACLKLHSHSALLLLEHIDDSDILNMINNQRKTPLHLSARNGLVNVTRELIRKGSSVLSLDANGMTPALCCAPDSDVAQCLALILANYSLCSQQGNNKDEKVMESGEGTSAVKELFVNLHSSNSETGRDILCGDQNIMNIEQKFYDYHLKFTSDKMELWKNTDYELYLNKIKKGLQKIKNSKNLDFVVGDMRKFDATLEKWPESLSTAVEIMEHMIIKISKIERAFHQIAIEKKEESKCEFKRKEPLKCECKRMEYPKCGYKHSKFELKRKEQSKRECKTEANLIKKFTVFHTSSTYLDNLENKKSSTDLLIQENLATYDSNAQTLDIIKEALPENSINKNEIHNVINATVTVADLKCVQNEIAKDLSPNPLPIHNVINATITVTDLKSVQNEIAKDLSSNPLVESKEVLRLKSQEITKIDSDSDFLCEQNEANLNSGSDEIQIQNVISGTVALANMNSLQKEMAVIVKSASDFLHENSSYVKEIEESNFECEKEVEFNTETLGENSKIENCNEAHLLLNFEQLKELDQIYAIGAEKKEIVDNELLLVDLRLLEKEMETSLNDSKDCVNVHEQLEEVQPECFNELDVNKEMLNKDLEVEEIYTYNSSSGNGDLSFENVDRGEISETPSEIMEGLTVCKKRSTQSKKKLKDANCILI